MERDKRMLPNMTPSDERGYDWSFASAPTSAPRHIDTERNIKTIEVNGEKVSILEAQYQAISSVAKNNRIDVQELLDRVTVEKNRIVGADFSSMDIKTLKGLQAIDTLKTLILDYNEELKTLEGLPLQSLESLAADSCGLTTLEHLRDARRLKVLSIDRCENLRSFAGLPTNIEELSTVACNIRDLSVFSDLKKLKKIDISENENIKALSGLPIDNLQVLIAQHCEIRSINILHNAFNLQELNLSGNAALREVVDLPVARLKKLDISHCDISNLSFLSKATQLTDLEVSGNKSLKTLSGLPLNPTELRSITADECSLPYSQLTASPRLPIKMSGKETVSVGDYKFELVINPQKELFSIRGLPYPNQNSSHRSTLALVKSLLIQMGVQEYNTENHPS